MTKDISDCAFGENDFRRITSKQEESDELYQNQKTMFLLGIGYLVKRPHPKIVEEYGEPPYEALFKE